MRAEPRISLNKLGEYMLAPPRRRRSIIKDQRTPPEFVVQRYTNALALMSEYLVDGRNDEWLLGEAAGLRSGPFTTDWQAQTGELCAEAVEAFLDTVDLLPIEGANLKKGHHSPEKLELGGVAVSVRPDILIEVEDSKKGWVSGAIKFAIGKNYEFTEVIGGYTSTLLQHYLDRKGVSQFPTLRSRCVVVDVFSRQVFPAPRASKSRILDLEAACEEISRAW